uniref:Small nuclear ribonucleoprotein 25 n=1 Tax=Oncorhynchus kisutch TaxID=8019 RepID=A0A8C7MER7_ONCKI
MRDSLPHSEFLDIFEEGLARLVQDPLLCDLPIQVTLEEVNSQVALEYGQAMTVRVCKADGEVMPIVVVQNAMVLDLKKAIQRFMELKQQREGGVKHCLAKVFGPLELCDLLPHFRLQT